MPDLDTVTMARCASLDGEHIVGKYTVHIGQEAGRAGASCTCKDFIFRKGPNGEFCKHIREVRLSGCCWNELYDGDHEKVTAEGKCPACGSTKIDYFKAGV